MSVRPIKILRRQTREEVEAILYDGLGPDELLLTERAWSPHRHRILRRYQASNVPRAEWPQSLHWDWSRKAPSLLQLDATGFGILADKQWQGLMLTRTVPFEAELGIEKGKPLVYVDYVESAPWNWRLPAIGHFGEMVGIGAALLREAVEQSIREGFHGRIGLHSLPSAESLYQELGMTKLRNDPTKQNLAYFEFDRTTAQLFLKGGSR